MQRNLHSRTAQQGNINTSTRKNYQNSVQKKHSFWLVEILESIFSGKHLDQQAIPLLEQGCSHGDARSCYWFGTPCQKWGWY